MDKFERHRACMASVFIIFVLLADVSIIICAVVDRQLPESLGDVDVRDKFHAIPISFLAVDIIMLVMLFLHSARHKCFGRLAIYVLNTISIVGALIIVGFVVHYWIVENEVESQVSLDCSENTTSSDHQVELRGRCIRIIHAIVALTCLRIVLGWLALIAYTCRCCTGEKPRQDHVAAPTYYTPQGHASHPGQGYDPNQSYRYKVNGNNQLV